MLIPLRQDLEWESTKGEKNIFFRPRLRRGRVGFETLSQNCKSKTYNHFILVRDEDEGIA